MNGKWRRRGLILLLVVGLLGVLGTHSLRRSQSSNPGAAAAPVACELLVVRREILIVSPAAGRLELLVAEGERVPAGQPLARIWPILGPGEDPLTVRAAQAGVVVLNVDGLESLLTPETSSALRPEGLLALPTGGSRRVEPGGLVAQGEPLLKIVDSLEPLLLVGRWPAVVNWQPAPGSQVYLRPRKEGGAWQAARVVAYGGGMVAMRLEQWGNEWLAVRRLPVEVRGKV